MRRHLRAALVLIAASMLLALPAVAAPFEFPLLPGDGFPVSYDPPSVTASSWILYDESTDTVLGEWDANTRRPIASITKIMTVLLAIENGEPDDEIRISQEVADTGGQVIGLVAGETVELQALIRAALLRSGNDSAAAIAEHIGGSIEGFVEMMNQRAQQLGMNDTHFVNPHGLDEDGHYSSARDMLTLGRQAMSYPEFAEVARSRVMVFPDAPDGSLRTATNTNRILNSYNGIIGVKTGETPRAGLTYVGAAERQGRRLYAVVLGSVGRRAHFADAIELFNWGFGDLGTQGMLSVGALYEPIAVRATRSPLLVEADSLAPSPSQEQGVASGPPEETVTTQTVEMTRRPDSGPDSLLSTLTYWFGLLAGASDE
ncbi:MAG: D-alanyl-D-alanine carboxypeptidase family protein [Acidimicrobiia bacterium]|jgi:D-alanyl-D-alanine carboxypeptidase